MNYAAVLRQREARLKSLRAEEARLMGRLDKGFDVITRRIHERDLATVRQKIDRLTTTRRDWATDPSRCDYDGCLNAGTEPQGDGHVCPQHRRTP